MKLHIFNPEHDLALAANLSRFTAPHAGRQLRSDLSFIPALWAEEGDFVLVDDIDCARDKARHLLGADAEKVEFITKLQLEKLFKDSFAVDSVHPWGWDAALKGELQRMGCPEIMLPTEVSLAQIRAISNRKWAAEHLQHYVSYVDSIEELRRVVAELEKAVIKSPWSCSGRGVKYVTRADFQSGEHLSPMERWAANIISQQGGITVEPYYNKVKDFGMEFEVTNGKVEYRGLSLFQTVKNAYTGNVLASEEEKMDMLTAYASADKLMEVRTLMMEKVENAVKDCYSGPFGIDMMICRDENENLFVNPCIELNLRRTMGHVALELGVKEALTPSLMRVEYDGNRYHLRVMPGKPSEQAIF